MRSPPDEHDVRIAGKRTRPSDQGLEAIVGDSGAQHKRKREADEGVRPQPP